jgi:radical SAM superfamily enzyme YgiQ (UPF0313 family)
VLTKNGHTVHLIFFKHAFYDDFSSPTEKELKILCALIQTLNLDILSISIGPFFLARMAERISEEIRGWFTGPVVWGGLYPTLMPQRCIPFTDLLCIGEGEEAFLELVNNLSEGKPPDSIKNLWVKKKNGEVIKNPVRPISPDLEYSPDLTGKNKYFIQNNRLSYFDPIRLFSFQYYTSATRGCPYSCSFCPESSFRKIYGHNRPIRKRSIENIISELANVKNALPDVRVIAFTDETFPAEREWMVDFTREYKRRVNLPFWCLFNPRLLNEDNVVLLKDAGLSFLGMGVQSGSRRIREDIFKRPESLEEIRRGVLECKKHNIVPNLDFIVDNPFENRQDRYATLSFLQSLPKPFEVSLFSLYFLPNTQLADTALKNALVSSEEIEKIYQAVPESTMATTSKKRPREELIYICLIALTGKKFIPRAVTSFLIRSKKTARFPLCLIVVALTQFLSYLYFIDKFLRYSRKRSIIKDVKRVLHYAKYALHVIR